MIKLALAIAFVGVFGLAGFYFVLFLINKFGKNNSSEEKNNQTEK